jgi:hypothetical protein
MAWIIDDVHGGVRAAIRAGELLFICHESGVAKKAPGITLEFNQDLVVAPSVAPPVLP